MGFDSHVRRVSQELLPHAETLASATVDRAALSETSTRAEGLAEKGPVWSATLMAEVLRHLAGAATRRDLASVAADLGRMQAERGTPLWALLQFVRAHGPVLWDAFVQHAKDDEHWASDALIGTLKEISDMLDSAAESARLAYRQTEVRLVRKHASMRERLIDDLLSGRGGTDAGYALGLLGGGVFVAAVSHAPFDAAPNLALANAAWAFRDNQHLGIIVVPPGGMEVLLPELERAATDRVSVSPPFTNLRALPGAVHLARMALRTVPATGSKLTLLDDNLLAAAARLDEGLANHLRASVFGQLLTEPEQRRSRLLEAIGAFLRSDGSLTTTADRLGLHRNTLLNRLRQVEELTGLTVRSPRDLALMAMALEALDEPAPTT